MYEIVSSFLSSISLADVLTSGVVAAIVSGAIVWIRKRNLENLKADNQRILEQHRAKVRNSEAFFDRQMEACDEIHKLKQDMLPEYKFPMMQWDDALEKMVSETEYVEKEAQRIYTEYYTVLPDKVLNSLNSAVAKAGEAKFERGSDPIPEHAINSTESAFNSLSSAAADTKKLLDGKTHSLDDPPLKKSN